MQEQFIQELQLENTELRLQISEAELEMEQATDLIDKLEEQKQPEFIDLVERLAEVQRNEAELESHLNAERGIQARLTEQLEFLEVQRSEYQEMLLVAQQEKRWMENRATRLEETVTRMNNEWHYWAERANANDLSFSEDGGKRFELEAGNREKEEGIGEVIDTSSETHLNEQTVNKVDIEEDKLEVHELKEQLAQHALELQNKDLQLIKLSEEIQLQDMELRTSRELKSRVELTQRNADELAEQETECIAKYTTDNDYLEERNQFLEEENHQLRSQNENLFSELREIKQIYEKTHCRETKSEQHTVRDLKDVSAEPASDVSNEDQSQGIEPSSSEMEEDNSIVHERSNFDISVNDLERHEDYEIEESNNTPPEPVERVLSAAYPEAPLAPSREYKQKMQNCLQTQPQTFNESVKITINADLVSPNCMKTSENELDGFTELDEQDCVKKQENAYERAIEYIPHTTEDDLGADIARLLGSDGTGKSINSTKGFGGNEFDNI